MAVVAASVTAVLVAVLAGCGGAVADHVDGVLRVDPAPPPLRGATLHVRLQDVGVADAPARTVAEYVRRDLAYDPAHDPPPAFRLSTTALPPGATTYVVTAHVDLDGDGEVERGDYVTKQSYPVTRDTAELEIVVRPV